MDTHLSIVVVEDNDDLPQWVHYQIATANDRLNQASSYMQYKIRRFKQAGSKAE